MLRVKEQFRTEIVYCAKILCKGGVMVACTYEPVKPVLPRFYAGRDIFITGATGFMGKVLVERLLSTSPDIGRLFLLMREKRGQPPHERLAQLKQSQVFDNIRAHCPHQLDKLVCITGDVSQPLLGLNTDAIAQLMKVSVVFHNAATVKFWEPLDVAVANNVTSVISLMDLCDQLPSLEALVHVSTAYTNAERRHIEERVYPAPAELSQVQDLFKALPAELLQEITPKYIHPKANTYLFSKALAEAAVDQRPGRRYSVAIVRPSIVVSALRAPIPGWIEGLSGTTGFTIGIGQGVLKVLKIDFNARADIIPVDIVIDNMIAVAWETATEKFMETRVYNCGSQENPLTWQQLYTCIKRINLQYPFDNVVFYPGIFDVKNKYVYKFLEVLVQTVPLYITEYTLKIFGVKTPMSLVTVAERLQAMNRVYTFFGCNDWTFDINNLRRLRQRLQKTDGHLYHLNINDVKWEEHLQNYVRGVRRYILRQKEEALPQARTHLQRLRMLRHGVLLLLAIACCILLLYIVQKVLIPRLLVIS